MILSLRSKPLGIEDRGKSALLLGRSSSPRESGSHLSPRKTGAVRGPGLAAISTNPT